MKIGNAISDSVPTNSNHRRIDWRARRGRGLKFLVREALVLTLILRHRETPWRAKPIAACTPGGHARSLKTTPLPGIYLKQIYLKQSAMRRIWPPPCGTHLFTRNPVARFIHDRTSGEGENPMSTARSNYFYAFLVLLAVAWLPVGAIAQNGSSSTRFQTTAPITFSSPFGSSFSVTGSVSNGDGTLMAEKGAAGLPEAPAAGQQTPPAAPPPRRVHKVTSQIQYEARRWHVGGRIGSAFSPELFMFGLQSQFGPIFARQLLFRPNADFSFGELTDMFALNLEGTYFLRTVVYRQWTPYFGMGPSLNFIHQGASARDVSFSDFTYKTGFNVLVGGQKGKTFIEMKTALWSGPAPVLRLLVGYNF